jgi:dihydroxyacetone kinase-like protein
MTTSSLGDVEIVVRTIAQTAVDNTTYFSELDTVVGDGDFGYSLRSGFEVVLSDFDTLDRANISAFLKRISLIMLSKVGGTSGPIWGTAFLRASKAAGEKTELSNADVIELLRSAITGIMERGGASLGEKTLLDALVPAVDVLEADLADPATAGAAGADALQRAADTAVKAAEDTTPMLAMRGRAAYTGERSIGSPDAGAVAIGVIFQAVSAAWRDAHGGR